MSRMVLSRSWWGWVVGILTWTLFSPVPAGRAAAPGQGEGPATSQAQGDFLEYRLRSGESLSEVARLFRIPVEELAQANRIVDPTRLQAGQSLRVPNVFARQTAQLQGERDRLLAESEQRGRELEQRQATLTAAEADLQRVEAEKRALTAHLASTLHWQRGAIFLAGLLVVALGWGLKMRGELAELTRRLTLLTHENAALNVIKEKYRQTAAQIEFRYQKLYSAREEIPAKFLAGGTAILARSFAEGRAQLEQLLASIKAEREREEQVLQAEQKARDFLFHPLRMLLQRYRIKYHEA